MKQIILFIIIMAISFSCKKQSVEPEPEPEPIKTSKSFSVKITFTSDSLCDSFNPIPGYYPSNGTNKHLIQVNIDTIPNGVGIKNTGLYIAGNGPTITITLQTTNGSPISISSNDLNKPFTYYINAKEQLRNPDGSVKFFTYSKIYTFHEGDNGTINFNTLP